MTALLYLWDVLIVVGALGAAESILNRFKRRA
jgi:hypothetical protein